MLDYPPSGLEPAVVDGYTVEKRLSSHPGGGLFLARQAGSEQPVFLLLFTPEPAEAPRLARNFRARVERLQQLDHPRIARIVDSGQTGQGQLYVATEYIPGPTLRDFWSDRQQRDELFPVAESLRLLRDLAGTLRVAHGNGLVHAHLRPAYVILQDRTPMLLGLELPAAAIPEAGPALDETGSPDSIEVVDYPAPEQAPDAPLDPRANIYTLGIFLYEMLAGHQPRRVLSDWNVFERRELPGPVPLRSVRLGLSEATYTVLRNCLSEKPWARFESMDDLIAAIDQALDEERPWTAPVAQSVRHAAMTIGSRRVYPLLLTALLIGAALLAVVRFVVGPNRLVATTPPASEPVVLAEEAGTQRPVAAVRPTETPPATTAQVAPPTEPPASPSPVVRPSEPPLLSPTITAAAAAPTAPAGPSPACPGDMVALDGGSLCLSSHEVTNEAYGACVAAGACTPPAFNRSLTRDSYFDNPGFADYPVVQVSWTQAQAYCRYLGGRLPTAAEWDRAAAGLPDSVTLAAAAGPADTVPVGSVAADMTPAGVADLGGNVREWVSDAEGISRRVRGNGFASVAGEIDRYLETVSDWAIGFRCAADS